MDAAAGRLQAAGFGRGNSSCLSELLASFFVETGALMDAWAHAALGTGASQLDIFKCAPQDCPRRRRPSLPNVLKAGSTCHGLYYPSGVWYQRMSCSNKSNKK